MNDWGHAKSVSTVVLLGLLLAWETVAPFLPFFRGRGGARTGHAARNFALGVVNGLLLRLLFVGAWNAVTVWTDDHRFGVLHWLGLTGVARVMVAVLLFDAWMYYWHRVNHRVGFLWRFHRTHHSDPQMDVTTAYRFHFGEIIWSSCARLPVLALLGMQLGELLLYETFMFAVVQLHHANVGLPARLDRALRGVIVTPALHKVHHSREQLETDSNYASLLSVWDRLFGSFRLRADPRTIEFGLKEFDAPEHHTLAGLARTPLVSAAPRSDSKP